MKSARPSPASLPVEIQHETGTPRVFEGVLQMAAETAALRHDGDGALWCPPAGAASAATTKIPRRTRRRSSVTKTVRANQSQPAGTRDLADALLLTRPSLPTSAKPEAKITAAFTLRRTQPSTASRTRGRRQREDGEIDALRQLVDAGQNLVALDIAAPRPTR